MSRFIDDQLTAYQRDGFFVARGLFARDEIDKLRHFAEEDPSFAGSVYGRKDSTGHETKLALWNHGTPLEEEGAPKTSAPDAMAGTR